MATTAQWYLCEISDSPTDDRESSRTTDNLAVTHPDKFGSWMVWLPIILRVGDTLQFEGRQVEVSKVVLQTNWVSSTGEMESSDSPLYSNGEILVAKAEKSTG